jgi:O-antigen/teichoic acid export membrane protein
MKTAFIFILFKTPGNEVERLRKEVKEIGLREYEIYFIDNTLINRGYAGGANEGIRQAMKDGADIFVIANPDISLTSLKGKDFLEGAKHFDIFGLTMHQDGKIYYGGEIDKWRMSGGLVDKKPKKRFVNVDFPSGSLCFIKKEVVDKIGFWDESYFLYYEEVDYAERARRAGFRVGIDSKLEYIHFETSKENPSKNYWLFKSRLKYLWKFGSLNQKIREILRTPKTIYEEILKRPFYVNFFSLNFSSVINKVLHFFLFLILIRSFKPEEYAVYTLAWTHIGLLSPLLDFGTTSYGLINLSGEKQKKLSTLFSFRVALSVVTFAITIILAFAFKYPPRILLAISLTSVVIFSNMVSGTYLIFASIANRSYMVSLVSMVFQIVLVLSLIATVFITRDLTNVFIAIFVLYFIYALVNYILIKREVGKVVFEFDWPSWIAIGKKSVMYLVISLMAGFYSKADVLILNFLKGAKDVGIYSAGYRFLDALMFMVVAYNVSAVPLFSSLFKEKKTQLFLSKIKKDSFLVGVIGSITAISFFILSPVVLPALMKGDYQQSIQVLRVIIFSLPLILLTSVFLGALYALGRTYNIILLFLAQVVYNVVSNYFLIPRFGYMASAWITVVGEVINATVSFMILYKAINEDINGRGSPLRP